MAECKSDHGSPKFDNQKFGLIDIFTEISFGAISFRHESWESEENKWKTGEIW